MTAILTEYARINLKRVHQTLANTNQLDYYIVPVLVDEKPNNLLIHIGLNEKMKFNYNKVNEEELAHSSVG